MTINMGGVDRIVRVVAGVALVAWALTSGPVWAWIGIVPIATAAIGWCPLHPVRDPDRRQALTTRWSAWAGPFRSGRDILSCPSVAHVRENGRRSVRTTSTPSATPPWTPSAESPRLPDSGNTRQFVASPANRAMPV